MRLVVEAENQKSGMTLQELQEAITKAKMNGMNKLGRVTLGFRGQIKAVTFEERVSI